MRMIALCRGVLLAATAAAAQPSLLEARPVTSWSGHISYVVGYKRLEPAWSPVEHQVEFGLVDLDLRPPSWPASLCAQILLTYAGAPPDLASARGDYSGVWEINLGARRVIEVSRRVSLFVGGGASVIGASASSWVDFGGSPAQVYEDSGVTVGAWTGAGLYRGVGARWHLGAKLQYSRGEVELFDGAIDAGGFHALGMIGRRL